jgi:hypothetical protein
LKYLFIIIISIPILTGICYAGQTADPNSKVVLTVEVTNGTSNGTSVVNDQVTIQLFQHEQLLQTMEDEVTDGNAIFENVPTGGHIVAVAQVMHQNMSFRGEPVLLGPGQNEHISKVQVYDVSFDKSKLSVEMHHIIIKAHPEYLEVTEFMQLKNSSDMAISSDKRDSQNRTIVLEIMLPMEFKNLNIYSYFENDTLVVTKSGFYDIMAVPPGVYPITFSYTLDITSDTMDITKKITLPTSGLMLFTDLGTAKLQGLEQLEKHTMSRNETPMEYYKLINLTSNDELTFRFSGFNVNKSGSQTWIILALVFCLLFTVVLWKLIPQKV